MHNWFGKKVRTDRFVSKEAEIASDVVVGSFVFIGPNVKIEGGAVIEPFCYLGDEQGGHVTIGRDSVIRSHSRIYGNVVIGKNFRGGNGISIRSNTTIGNNVSVGTGSDIQGDCFIGDNSRLHSNVHVCQGSEIGRFCWIFPGVILTNDSRPPSPLRSGPKIQDEVVLAVNVTVMPGVSISKGTVALPGALISRDTEADSLHFGPRPSSAQSTASLKMPNADEPAYPWILRFGDDTYDSLLLHEQRKLRQNLI